MAPMNEHEFSQMLKDVRELERKYDMVLSPVFEEDAIAALIEAVGGQEGEAVDSMLAGLVRDAWTSEQFKSDIRDAYSSDEPLRTVLFNTFRFNLYNWAIPDDAKELPRRISI